MKRIVSLSLLTLPLFIFSQTNQPTNPSVMTPELLWKLGRVSGSVFRKMENMLCIRSVRLMLESNKGNRKTYRMPVNGGPAVEINNPDSLLTDKDISPDGK